MNEQISSKSIQQSRILTKITNVKLLVAVDEKSADHLSQFNLSSGDYGHMPVPLFDSSSFLLDPEIVPLCHHEGR